MSGGTSARSSSMASLSQLFDRLISVCLSPGVLAEWASSAHRKAFLRHSLGPPGMAISRPNAEPSPPFSTMTRQRGAVEAKITLDTGVHLQAADCAPTGTSPGWRPGLLLHRRDAAGLPHAITGGTRSGRSRTAPGAAAPC